MASKKHKKNKSISFGQKIFGRFGKKKSEKNKKDKKDATKNGKSRTSKTSQKSHKTIDVRPPKEIELKVSYNTLDVINYQSQVIRSVNDEKRQILVTEKLRLCSVCFDFSTIIDDEKAIQQKNDSLSTKKKMDGIDPSMIAATTMNQMRLSRTLSMEQKEENEQSAIGIDKKRQMLVELIEFISTSKWWNEQILKELIDCVQANLFRTLPLNGSKRKFVKGDEEEEPFLDPQWLHLQLVYELCLRFLISNDIDKKVMQRYLDGKFVMNLIQLFQSEDLRERDYLKTILHRIYGRFMPLRQQIRTQIANECYRYVYGESRAVYGIAEFLDIFSSIINGFSIPVKDEHKAFLRNVLLPLHKCNKYENYFQQLADCCVLFVNKEQNIASTVIGGLLKFWPKLSPTKQAFYLREMLNVIGALVEHENGFSFPKYKEILLLSISKIFECMESPHFQVCEQALSLWKDTVMLYLSKCQKELIWRRLFVIFKDIELNHWNATIKQLANEVVAYYERIDTNYWKKLQKEYADAQSQKETMTNGEIEFDENEIIKIPQTLVPQKYKKTKLKRLNEKSHQRNKKYEKMKQIAMKNKKMFDENEENDSKEVSEESNENKNENASNGDIECKENNVEKSQNIEINKENESKIEVPNEENMT